VRMERSINGRDYARCGKAAAGGRDEGKRAGGNTRQQSVEHCSHEGVGTTYKTSSLLEVRKIETTVNSNKSVKRRIKVQFRISQEEELMSGYGIPVTEPMAPIKRAITIDRRR